MRSAFCDSSNEWMCHACFLSHLLCTINQYRLALNGFFAVGNFNKRHEHNSLWNENGGTRRKDCSIEFSLKNNRNMPIIMQPLKVKCADVSISPNCDLICKMQSVVQSRTTTSTPINRTYEFDSDTNLFRFRSDKTKYKRLRVRMKKKNGCSR